MQATLAQYADIIFIFHASAPFFKIKNTHKVSAYTGNRGYAPRVADLESAVFLITPIAYFNYSNLQLV